MKDKYSMEGSGSKKPAGKKTIKGYFISHPRGFGFVKIDPPASKNENIGSGKDVYISRSHTLNAVDGDYVEVMCLPCFGQRPEGWIVSILRRGVTEVVGTYCQDRWGGSVVPENRRLNRRIALIKDPENGAEAREGDKVVVRILDYGTKDRQMSGVLIENLGPGDAPGMDVLAIVRSMDLPMAFPDKVLSAAARVPERVSEGDIAGREDFRSWQIVTIDGPDAKDLDDAVSLTKSEKGFCLGVHIADVSHYVVESSAMDREALLRGTSIYLTDRVIPMLPERLSNGICSLSAGEDRLTLSCIMDFDLEGRMVSHRIVKGVIRVGERMTYPDVKAILTEDVPELRERYKDYLDLFFRMWELSKLLRSRRKEAGAIDFDFPETKIVLDGTGKPVDIIAGRESCATEIIEDFMIAANETVAETFCRRGLPFIYRIHEEPDAEKIENVLALIRLSGGHVRMNTARIRPRDVQAALKAVKGRPEEGMISRLMLRAMQRARYSPECKGHFGLAARYYCHFTSPIRRYPDLQIHRIISDVLLGWMTPEKEGHYRAILEEVADQSSLTEQRAAECERETVKLAMARFMSERIGERFDGVVSGIVDWGMYVVLPNTVEGLVRPFDMGADIFYYDEATGEMAGEYTGDCYRMGDPVRVAVKSVDIRLRTIDFTLEGRAQRALTE